MATALLFDRVKFLTSTTGTGSIAVGAAFNDSFFTTSEAGVPNGATVTYCAEDGLDVEEGRGTYSTTGPTLSRDTVLRSKIGGTAGTSKINLSGNAVVFLTAAKEDLVFREVLTANQTYFVRTDGNDNNTGLADSSGGAFLTIQKAINTIANTIDLAGFDVTIQVRDGTFTVGAVIDRPWVGRGTVLLQGNTTTPANCIISTTSADGILARRGGTINVQGFKVQTTTGGNCLQVDEFGVINVTGNMEYGACAGAHFSAGPLAPDVLTFAFGLIFISANYSITGNALQHYSAANGGCIHCQGRTITLTGTPAFSSAFALSTRLAILRAPGNTFSGSATGIRYSVNQNSVIETGGGGANYFPGNAAGVAATGGIYA